MIPKLLDFFLDLGYTWSIDGVQQSPTQDDLEKTLDKAREMLYAETIPSQIEIGNLLVQRVEENTFDVYLRIGALP